MKLFSELFPTIIYETSSPISGPIKIVDSQGERRLMIGNLIQSVNLRNPLDHKVWGKLAAYPFPKRKELSVLILGLGGGTTAHLIARKLNIKGIIGVEIDPVVVELGKKYFELERIKKLSVVIGDAARFIKKSDGKFDFIIVDTYQGDVFPKDMERGGLLRKLRNSLNRDGVLVFNRIFLSSRPEARLKFLKRLQAVFGKINEKVVEGPSDAKNYLYWIIPSHPGVSPED